MRDTLRNRVGRIIAGSFYALVDVVENAAPEVVMEQALREIDGAIEEVRGELGTAIASKHLANSTLRQIQKKCEDIADKIELAVEQGRDDLAEIAIAQQLDLEAQLPVLEGQIKELADEETKLEGYIAALRAKKREMCEELRQFRENKEASDAAGSAAAADGASAEGKVSRADSAFHRVMDRASSGLSANLSGADNATMQAMNELENMARKNRVQERLAVIKGKKGKA